VANTQLSDQGVDGTQLNSLPPTSIVQRSRIDMVLSIRRNKWERSKAFDQRSSRLGA
jgi:hypothetical protein